MNKLIAAGVIAILIVTAVTLIGFGYLQDEKNQLNPEHGSSPTPTPTPTPATTPTPSPSNQPTEPASIPKPAIPEFTVALIDTSYDVPTTYSTDGYTGDTIIHEGYHVERRTMEVKIKNQQFTPFTDSNGHNITFYYNIRVKGHYTEWGSENDGLYNFGEMPTRSDSEYTVISYNSEGTYRFRTTRSGNLEVSPDGEVDFQVKALIGYPYEAVTGPGFHGWFFEGKESDWSSTQTIKIP